MKLEKYREIMENIEIPEGLEQRLYAACAAGKQRPPKRKKSSRFKLTAACACMAALILAVGIPVMTVNPRTGQSELAWSGLTVTVKAGSVESDAVVGERLSLGEADLLYSDGAEPVFAGSSGLSFRIEGENIDKIEYKSQSQSLHCEFFSQNHPGGSEAFLWSGYSFAFETETFLEFVEDPENPTKEELVALLEDKRRQLREGITDDYHEMERFEEMTGSSDLDFSSLILSGTVSYKGESSLAFVFVENPDNRAVPTSEGPELTTGAGEDVDWVFSRATLDYLSETPIDQVDYSKLEDTVDITAYMTDGTCQNLVFNVEFDENGRSTAYFTRPGAEQEVATAEQTVSEDQ